MYCFSEFCRFCLANNTYLFDYNLKDNNELSYYEQIIELVPNLQYITSEKFPKLICIQCITQLKACVKFKQTCLKSQRQLFFYCKQLKLNKEYCDEDDTVTTLNVQCEDISKQNILKQKTPFVPKEDIESNTDLSTNISQFGVNNFQSQLINSVWKKTFSINDDSQFINPGIGDLYCQDDNERNRKHLKMNLMKKEINDIITNYSFHSEEIIKEEYNHENESILFGEKMSTSETDERTDNLYSESDNESSVNHTEMNLTRDEINTVLPESSLHSEEITVDEDDVLKETSEGILAQISIKKIEHKSKCEDDLHKTNKIHKRTYRKKIYCCKTCDKICKTITKLKIHERTHTGEKPYSCEICNRQFAEPTNLKRHKRIHTGEKPYSCEICNKKLSSSHNLKVHKRSHTSEKFFSCKTCDRKFSLFTNLLGHERLHRGQKPYVCEICDKQYSYKKDLIIHKRLHTGERPYCCKTCDKTFRSSHVLKKHERMHTGEKPYTCGICETICICKNFENS